MQGMNFIVAGIMVALLDSQQNSCNDISPEDQEERINQLHVAEPEIFWLMCGVLETTKMKELWRKGLPR